MRNRPLVYFTEMSAEELKLKGNKYFGQRNYEESITCYTTAIQIDSLNAVLFSNRAMAYIKLKRFWEAERDCTSAIALNSTFDKAYYRRGLTRKELKQYKSALADFKAALKLSPKNNDIKKEYDNLKRFLENMSKIRIDPIKKDFPFKSNLPLQAIPIQDLDNTKSQIGMDVVLSDFIKKLVASHTMPKSYSEFITDWRELSSCQISDKIEYLERIEISAFEKIFTFPFDSQTLYEIFVTLSKSKNNMFIFQILQFITKMPRFDLNICFFGEEDFQVLRNIFQNLIKSDQAKKDDIILLAEMYNVKIDEN